MEVKSSIYNSSYGYLDRFIVHKNVTTEKIRRTSNNSTEKVVFLSTLVQVSSASYFAGFLNVARHF